MAELVIHFCTRISDNNDMRYTNCRNAKGVKKNRRQLI